MRGARFLILGMASNLFRHNPKVKVETDVENMKEHLKKLSTQELRERAERRRKMKARKRKTRKNKNRRKK